ncbi:MAG: hypothetical protein JW801_10565 [Bacteroidales bacterium]|nr:hypothetical protein [Bacteroidales bacterium]
MRNVALPCILVILFLVSCERNKAPDLIDIDKDLKAFPTAEGYGAYATGGRGGSVLYVTNLNEDGPGSLREALESEGPRTVVFAVSGTLALSDLIQIKNPYLTIAGQTAPAKGITLINSGIAIKTHDVIIRHIRIRPGDASDGYPYEDRDAIVIGNNSYNVILDHVSASWAVDEIISTWSEPQQITVQWSIFSEALSYSKHPEGEHSKAFLIASNTQKISVHHNLFAHNNDRTPAIVGEGVTGDLVNNLVYNWGQHAFTYSSSPAEHGCNINLMYNHFLKGRSSIGDFFPINREFYDSKIFIGGNTGDDSLLIEYNTNPQYFITEYDFLVNGPVGWEKNIEIDVFERLWESVLEDAGATLPKRDETDERIVNDVLNLTGKIINSQDELGGYPEWPVVILSPAELDAYDFDRDGMADAWERKNDLDPTDPEDRNSDIDGNGYTNLEEFLNKE